jgi:hypothetical protein
VTQEVTNLDLSSFEVNIKKIGLSQKVFEKNIKKISALFKKK